MFARSPRALPTDAFLKDPLARLKGSTATKGAASKLPGEPDN